MKAKHFGAALTLGGLLLARSSAAQSAYTITDLGSLNGSYSAAYGISASGLVCGVSGLIFNNGIQSGTVPRPVTFSNGQVTNLGTFITQPIPIDQQVAKAGGINDSGQVVGYASTNTNSEAFLYSNGALQQTPTTQNAINNRGDRVGGPSYPSDHALVYSNGAYTDLGTLGGGQSTAYALNNVGQIVGQSDTVNAVPSNPSAFLYQNGKMQDIGKDTSLFNTEAHGINDSGVVVGLGFAATNGTGERGFIWQNGSVQLLGTLGGISSGALGVNNKGTVIGYTQYSTGSTEPFLYQNGQMSDLFAGSGWFDGEATAINDNGWIVGYGVHNGITRAFLAKPNAVPAPGSLLTCAVGGGVLTFAVRRRKRAA